MCSPQFSSEFKLVTKVNASGSKPYCVVAFAPNSHLEQSFFLKKKNKHNPAPHPFLHIQSYHMYNTYDIKNYLATYVGTHSLQEQDPSPEVPGFIQSVQENTKTQKQLTTHTRKKSQRSSSTSIKLAVSMNHIRNV